MGMGFVGAYAGGPVQQSPVQQSPVQQSPVQQSPVQQSPVQQTVIQAKPVFTATSSMSGSAQAAGGTAALGGSTTTPSQVTQVPIQVVQVPLQVTQVPTQQVVQQTPVQAVQPPAVNPNTTATAAAGGAADGVAALTSTLQSTIAALTHLVQQLMDRIKQPQNVVQQTSTTSPTLPTPPKDCPHTKAPATSTLASQLSAALKGVTDHNAQIAIYHTYAAKTTDEQEKSDLFKMMIEPWSPSEKAQLSAFFAAVSKQHS